MKRDATESDYFPSQYGIKRHRHEDGKLEWAIEVVIDEVTGHTQSARYDARRGKWILQQPSKQLAIESSEQGDERQANVRLGPEWTNVFPISSFTSLFLKFDWAQLR